MIRCPNCKIEISSIRDVAACSYEEPVKCVACGEYFWTNRIFSKFLAYGVGYSGLGFVIVILSFMNGIGWGAFSIIAMLSIYYLVALFEVHAVGLKVREGYVPQKKVHGFASRE